MSQRGKYNYHKYDQTFMLRQEYSWLYITICLIEYINVCTLLYVCKTIYIYLKPLEVKHVPRGTKTKNLDFAQINNR